MDAENRVVATRGKEVGGGQNWERDHLYGDECKLEFWWWACCSICQIWNILLHTSNIESYKPMILQQKLKKKKDNRDFPSDPVVKNLPFNAEDSGSIPVWGTNISRAMGQVSSPHTPHNYWACTLGSPHAISREKPDHHNKKIPHATAKVPLAATKTWYSQINIF